MHFENSKSRLVASADSLRDWKFTLKLTFRSGCPQANQDETSSMPEDKNMR